MNINRLKAQLIVDEDKRSKPYLDTKKKITIGIGRNLSDTDLSPDEILYLFGNDLQRAIHNCELNFNDFEKYDDVRQEVVINMMFNMGFETFSKWTHFKNHFNNHEYFQCAEIMEHSLWHKQVGIRADRLIRAMKLGSFELVDNRVKR